METVPTADSGVDEVGVEVAVDAGSDAYVLALDVGTTTLRAHIYNRHTKICGEGARQIELLHPQQGWAEMDPDVLWQQVQDVIKDAIKAASLQPTDITCMGITTQRNTFITWDSETNEPFHRFVTWQDLRASDYVQQWMKSYMLWAMNTASRFVHFLTRKKRFLAAAVLKFKSTQVLLRLKYVIDHDEQLQKRIKEKKVRFGNLDTWLLWKLTNHEVFATEYSCASSTAMYDPFLMQWSSFVAGLIKLPLHIMPPVKDTSGFFGRCHPSIFGHPIPITAMVADQQSAMFGQCCFEEGDVKCTMGTGTFISCNTGNKPHASVAGLYPLVGWKIGRETVFIAEGHSSDTGICLEWARKLGVFEDVKETSQIAASLIDSGGVCFVPAFSGLQAPINDERACAALLGLKPDTSRAHILRAVLESLAFRFKLLYDAIQKETSTPLTKTIRCDGGVCNNDFVMQLVSNLTQRPLDRPVHLDMTSLGAAFLAGLAAGVWKSKDELKQVRKTRNVFQPSSSTRGAENDTLAKWRDALKRSMAWYQHVEQ